jgi:hypothetical protein
MRNKATTARFLIFPPTLHANVQCRFFLPFGRADINFGSAWYNGRYFRR